VPIGSMGEKNGSGADLMNVAMPRRRYIAANYSANLPSLYPAGWHQGQLPTDTTVEELSGALSLRRVP